MKLNTQSPATTLALGPNPKVTTFNFSPENQGLIARTLYNGLYQDPLKASIRETLCNALDAHVEVEKELTPLRVQLPTEESPVFLVRDFGPGIGPDRMEIVSSWGESTKREDNRQTGGFGYGLKAIWSYAELFILTTWVNGFEYNYCLQPGVSGIGEYIELEEPKSSPEPNGTQIQIAIQPKDIQQARDVYLGIVKEWDTRPETNPFSKIQDPVVRGEGWRIWESQYSYSSSAKVRMGGVTYSVGDVDCRHGLAHWPLLTIDVEIGTLDIESSREGLQTTDHNVQVLEQRFSEIAESIALKLQEGWEEPKTLIQAQTQLQQSIERLFKWNLREKISLLISQGWIKILWNATRVQTDYYLPKGVVPYHHHYRSFRVSKRFFAINFRSNFVLSTRTPTPRNLALLKSPPKSLPSVWIKAEKDSVEELLTQNPWMNSSGCTLLLEDSFNDPWKSKSKQQVRGYKVQYSDTRNLMPECFDPEDSIVYCSSQEWQQGLWFGTLGYHEVNGNIIFNTLESLGITLAVFSSKEINRVQKFVNFRPLAEVLCEKIPQYRDFESVRNFRLGQYVGFAKSHIVQPIQELKTKLKPSVNPTLWKLLTIQEHYLNHHHVDSLRNIVSAAKWAKLELISLEFLKELEDFEKAFPLGLSILRLDTHNPIYRESYDYFNR